MERSGFTEEQISGVRREQDAGAQVSAGRHSALLLTMASTTQRHRIRRFSSFRANVRRCMPRRRAVSEMLKSVSTKVW
jgi:hypothetical protein